MGYFTIIFWIFYIVIKREYIYKRYIIFGIARNIWIIYYQIFLSQDDHNEQ